eukprot:TRINITY_DN6252_c0_g3_i4.p1 TRINITY_DN6252_c0_g3~~TRINITY_DN6252_c0_g3_i4.p1  ORF type:complete len:300 (-),score=48.37 TRINITY_DN6252_c0_g3_i4:554-1453(-)
MAIQREDWQSVYRGAHAFLAKNYLPANRLLQKAFESPSLANYKGDLYKLQAFLFLNTKQYNDAINAASASIDEKPNDAETFYYLGLAYLCSKDRTSALKYLERGHQLDPQHELLRFYYRNINMEATALQISKLVEEAAKCFLGKEPDRAVSLVTKAQEYNPLTPIWGIYFATIYLSARNWLAATQSIISVATTWPDYVKENTIYSGEVQKKGELNPSYKKRWLVIFHHFYLIYYKVKEDVTPQGVILLYRATPKQSKNELTITTHQKKRFQVKTSNIRSSTNLVQFNPSSNQTPLKIPA